MFHMKEAKAGGCACVLVLLFSGFVTSSGVLGSPLTDDVATLQTLKENIPNDYKIPIRYISKEVDSRLRLFKGGACWLLLSLYPAESSLKTLAFKFGNLSSNRENITIFITMLQGLRITIDSEELEAAMQGFKCHYQSVTWATTRYFDHVKDVLTAFASTPHQFHCTPPPCDVTATPPRTPGQGSQKHLADRAIPGLLALLIIPCVATLALALRTMLCRRTWRTGRRHDSVCSSPNTDGADARSSPEVFCLAPYADPESWSQNQEYRVPQDTLRSGDTAV